MIHFFDKLSFDEISQKGPQKSGIQNLNVKFNCYAPQKNPAKYWILFLLPDIIQCIINFCTCSGVKATLEAVPATCFLTVVLPPHTCCFWIFCYTHIYTGEWGRYLHLPGRLLFSKKVSQEVKLLTHAKFLTYQLTIAYMLTSKTQGISRNLNNWIKHIKVTSLRGHIEINIFTRDLI